MTPIRSSTRLALLLVLLCSVAARGEAEPRISALSYLDQRYMQEQRAGLDDLAARNLGRHFRGERDNDLQLLQQLLDRRVVGQDQTRELQAMGIVMGDLLAADLGMHWVIYEDGLGRSRALRYRDSDEYLFPVTMISRRREADNRTPVVQIYQKAYDIIAELKPPLPFR